MSTSTITLNREQARYFVDAALSAVSRDDITPVICGALITREGDKLRMVCTDRYRAHTALVATKSIEGDLEFIIPREALGWLSKNLSYFGSYMRVHNRITIDVEPHEESGRLTVTVAEHETEDADSVVWSGHHTKGNFPPVIRIIEKARDAEAILATPRFNLGFLAPAAKLQRHREGHPEFKFTASDTPGKDGPLYMAFRDGDEVYAEAILQPMVLR